MSADPRAVDLAVTAKDISKRFGPIRALRHVHLDIPSGETFGLIGPNGAGKTTFIRILLGLTATDGGEARVLGVPLPPRAILPRIGYMPQTLALYADLTVRENLLLWGRLAGMERDAIAQRAGEVLNLVGLPERQGDLVASLSGGMRRRTSLAAALLHDPDLLLLDEPTVGIDPELRAAFWSYFARLTARGKTVLITTHYMDEASRCGVVGLIHKGSVLAVDTPEAIRTRTGTVNLEDAFLSLVQGGGTHHEDA